MCFVIEVSSEIKKYEKRFSSITTIKDWPITGEINGFAHPDLLLIYNDEPQIIKSGIWGLKPFWAKDNKIMNQTLNARIETIGEKPSFRNYVNNRCMVIIDAFYEWKWLDEKGKNKEKYRIRPNGFDPFALAGIYAEDNMGHRTFSIVTTVANTLMAEIHNTKKRMPVVLTKENEAYWLNGGAITDFADCSEVALTAIKQ